MNKKEFMRRLKECLVGLNQTDKREILLDYEEHFLDGIKEGRTEEEISESLGDPKEIAENLRKNNAKSTRGGQNDGVNTAGYIIGIIALAVGSFWVAGLVISVIGTAIGCVLGLVVVAAVPLAPMIKITAIAGMLLVVSVSAMLMMGFAKLTILVIRWFKNMINGLTDSEEKKIKREFKMIKFPAWLWILLAVIAVLSFGGVIYGGINVGVDMVQRYENGDLDAVIDNIEDMENIDDWDEWDDFEFFFDNFDGFRGFGFWRGDASSVSDAHITCSNGIFGLLFIGEGKVLGQETLDLSGVSSVEIVSESAYVTIESGDFGKATVRGKTLFDVNPLVVRKEGSTLKISVGQKVIPRVRNMQLAVVLPESVYDVLDIRNSSGATHVNGIQVDTLIAESSSGVLNIDGGNGTYDTIELTNSSGMITVGDIESVGFFSVKSTSGYVKVDTVSAESFYFKNTSGMIKGTNIKGDIDANTSSGNISIDGQLGLGESSFKCSSGRIALELAPTPMNIKATASSGMVRVEESDTIIENIKTTNSYLGTYYDDSADAANVTADTSSGAVTISFK